MALAKEFEGLVLADGRFEISADVILGLVCFRLKVVGAYGAGTFQSIDRDCVGGSDPWLFPPHRDLTI